MSSQSNKKRILSQQDDYRGPPSTKKTKKEKTVPQQQQHQSNVDVFSVDLVATAIFSFLDTKELYGMSKTSKYLRSLIRPEHVVRSALMHGGHAQQSMRHLVALVRERRIWIPTTLRMLRICNGRRCECCNGARVNTVNKDYGVFFCWQGCIQDGGFSKKVGMNRKWSPLVAHDRCAAAKYSNSAYIFLKPYKDSCGDAAGPLITKHEMDMVLKKDSETTLDKQLQVMDEQKDEEAEARALEIVEAFDKSEQEARNRHKETQQKKEKATQNAIERKRQKTLEFLGKLGAMIDDSAPWKELALAYQNGEASTSSGITIFMRSRLVRDLLQECLKSPSKAKKQKLQEYAEDIEAAFTEMWERHLHDFAFMPESNEYKKALKAYYQKKYADYSHLYRVSERDLRDIRKDQDPLPKLMNFRWPGSYDVEHAAAQWMVASLGDTVDEKYKGHCLECFAIGQCWRKTTEEFETHEERLNACLQRFPQMVKQSIAFLESPETKAWMKKNDEQKGPYDTIEVAIQTMYLSWKESYSHLQKNDTSQLLVHLSERIRRVQPNVVGREQFYMM